MKYINLVEAKEIYKQGKTLQIYLAKFNEENNSSEIIEITYDLWLAVTLNISIIIVLNKKNIQVN